MSELAKLAELATDCLTLRSYSTRPPSNHTSHGTDADITHLLLYLGPNGVLADRHGNVHIPHARPLCTCRKYQQAAQCQGSQMDFLIHLFAASSFNPRF